MSIKRLVSPLTLLGLRFDQTGHVLDMWTGEKQSSWKAGRVYPWPRVWLEDPSNVNG